MDTLALLAGILLCLVVVNGRHLEENHDPSPISDSLDHGESMRKRGTDLRHRRKRWQANYGYDYPVPSHGYPYADRREYDRNHQDLLPQIVKLLEEIAVYVRRAPPPPPPPQPIYIPYPVPYPVPQFGACTDKAARKPNISTRFPEMEDTNQNWGFVESNEDADYESGDGARPISFDPIKPLRPMKRPAPKVEHGSKQMDNQRPTTQAPRFVLDEPGLLRTPTMCNAAVLSCCADNIKQQKKCFDNFGCSISYDNGNACSNDSINEALESFKRAYSPVS
ncbi:uncharacterized protein LOC113500859 [Trichoplusia ni]|uniref:Uncharacterized protein LOC113500859 n=1 Tax=Trichoplusia ni TaxID=7111 RepID=A0A7E5WA94_TRINI|nr:uncharacterized protein LOC113500859 [Trichoplusia ni]